MPAARISDDGLAYQKRRLLRGLARLASCERNGDEDLYGAIWQCSRLQLVRIRIKVPGPLVVAAEHIKRGFRTARGKASIVAAVLSSIITIEEVCQRYGLPVDEFLSWHNAMQRHGL